MEGDCRRGKAAGLGEEWVLGRRYGWQGGVRVGGKEGVCSECEGGQENEEMGIFSIVSDGGSSDR